MFVLATGSGYRFCECYRHIGPIKIYNGCGWEGTGKCTLNPQTTTTLQKSSTTTATKTTKTTAETEVTETALKTRATTETPSFSTTKMPTSEFSTIFESHSFNMMHDISFFVSPKEVEEIIEPTEPVLQQERSWIKKPTFAPVVHQFTFKFDTMPTKSTVKQTQKQGGQTNKNRPVYCEPLALSDQWHCSRDVLTHGTKCSTKCKTKKSLKTFKKRCICNKVCSISA